MATPPKRPVKSSLGTASFTQNTNSQYNLQLTSEKNDGLDQSQASTDQNRSVKTSICQELSSTSQQSELNRKTRTSGGKESSSTSQQSELNRKIGTSGGKESSSTSQQSEPEGKNRTSGGQESSSSQQSKLNRKTRTSDGQGSSSTSQQSELNRKIRTSGGKESSSTSQQSEPEGKTRTSGGQESSSSQQSKLNRKTRTSGGQESSSSSQQSEPEGNKAVTMYKLLLQAKVLEEWQFPGVGITFICPTTDGLAWTSNHYSDTLTLLDKKGKIIQQVKHNNYIIDISLSPATETLWVIDREHNIKELVSGQLIHGFCIQGEPKCICVTASNHIIVGMTRNLTKFNTQGHMILSTSVTWTEKPLVCTPWRIAECPVTQNIAVADWNVQDDGGDGKRHVIVIDSDFNKLFVYRSKIPGLHREILCPYTQSSRKGAELFIPCCVVYDSVGNIIIGDYHNCRLLLISGRGDFLRIIHTDREITLAVGLHKEDVLWAAFLSKVKILQYRSV